MTMHDPAPEWETPGRRAPRHELAHDVVLPTLLLMALGGMTWAVRGCSGFGAVAGCVFAGVGLGTAWWYLAQSADGVRRRRYDSGWIVLAMTVGVGMSGARGWMQWHSFFDGKLMTDAAKNQFVPIDRVYGFVWLFLAGVPWAGLGACLLAWCGSRRETRLWHWALRLGMGFGGAWLARWLYFTYPQYFLPLYSTIEARYKDLPANPTLRRLVNDNGAAMTHLGVYLAFLLYEALRKEGKNVVLILTVGLVNGVGWSLLQNWTWARHVWPGASFNFWRSWETSGGLSIGLAYGTAYALVNREMPDDERRALADRRPIAWPSFEWLLVFLGCAWGLSRLLRPEVGAWVDVHIAILIASAGFYYVTRRRLPRREDGSTSVLWALLTGTAALAIAGVIAAGLFLPTEYPWWYNPAGSAAAIAVGWLLYLAGRPSFDAELAGATPGNGDPNLERFGLAVGLIAGLGLSLKNGLKGWFNIYRGREHVWDLRLWDFFGPGLAALLVLVALWVILRPRAAKGPSPRFSHPYGVMWLVLIVLNVIAQLVTDPHSHWDEVVFSLYYVLLFLLSATIVFHYQTLREREA